MRRGRVYLVGAGPGDPGLLTVRGRRVLRRAEVVVYDRLVDPRVLALAPRSALRVFAGKAPGHHTLPQAEITALLIAHAERGQCVVRLKGGDPFVFGRGGEEAEALAARGVRFQVVPGVSAAVAVPASAGIPLTHRRLASSFAVVTGHAADDAPPVDWARLATAVDTLVVLMGLARLAHIVAALLSHGRARSTPVAVIEQGTTPAQRTIVGTLGNIVARAESAVVAPPAVIVIGEVVALSRAATAPPGRPERLEGLGGHVGAPHVTSGEVVALSRAATAPPGRPEPLGGMGGHVGAPHVTNCAGAGRVDARRRPASR